MDAINQNQTCASGYVVEINWVGLPSNPVKAWPVLHTEGDEQSTHTCGRCLNPHAFIAWDFHEQELCPVGPLIEGSQIDSRDVRPPSEVHCLGPCEPTEPVAMNHIGVRSTPFSLITHDRIIEVVIELPSRQVASCMMQSPRVPYLVKYRLPGLSCGKELGKPVPPTGGRGISSGHEEIPRCKHQRVFVRSSTDLCLILR